MINSQRENKFKYIDALRGIAILMVIIVHTKQHGSVVMPKLFSVFLSLGSRGVQLFFVASAITLFLSLNRRITIEENPTFNFFVRRFFRIAPMYYIAIIYYLFQDGFGERYWLGNQDSITNFNIISNITFLHGINPYWITSLVPGGWSIAVEMMFYFFIPFLFKYIKTFSQAINFLIFSLIIKFVFQEILLLNSFGVLERLLREYLYFYFPSQLPVFAIGIVVYFVIFRDNKLYEIKKYKALLILFLIIAQVGVKVDILFVNHILFAILFGVLTFLLSKGKISFLINKVTIFLGKISYSLYIVHFAVIYWLEYYNLIDFNQNYLINFIVKLIVVVMISSFISFVTYNLIEIKFQSIASNIINKFKRAN